MVRGGWSIAVLLLLLLTVACTPTPPSAGPPTTAPRPTPEAATAAPPTTTVLTPQPAAPIASPTRVTCAFQGGFALLVQALGPEVAGACLEDERINPADGNAEQRTTRGLLVWRRADNAATFTNGATTWHACPGGLEQRPSNEAFRCGTPPAALATSPPATAASTSAAAPACPGAISWSEAKANVGQRRTVQGGVIRGNYASASNGQPTFLDVGNAFPNPSRFGIVIWGRNRGKFPSPPEQLYAGKTICVTGTIGIFRDVPQIEVEAPAAIVIIP